MKRWHMVFDVDKCLGCYTCMLSCKDEHVGNEWLPYTDRQKKRDQKWIEVDHRERGVVPRIDLAYRPRLCNHCDEPACAKTAPGCVIKRSDGIVLLDPRKAVGNEGLVQACPYGAISWNDEVGAAQKCTFCAHLIDDGWKEPRCVHACPLRALMAVHMEDHEFEKLVKEKELVAIVPEDVGPRVWYKNLHRFTKNFIAGQLLKDGDVASGITVSLTGGGINAELVTDMFGEFRFDGLENGEYILSVSGKELKKVQINGSSIDAGDFSI
ncbi:MAG: oxidoreductase [Clostridiales bacterium]|nr:oxidoreductase [Clostridiales bacterium]